MQQASQINGASYSAYIAVVRARRPVERRGRASRSTRASLHGISVVRSRG